MDDDWDLQAVVRGCTITTSSSAAASTTIPVGGFTSSAVSAGDFSVESCFSSYGSESASGLSLFSTSDPYETRHSNVLGELQELYKPFFPKSHQIKAATAIYFPHTAPISPIVVSKQQTQLKQQHQQLPKQSPTGSVNSSANSHTPRPKRRKNQLKRICQVPAEALSSDVWAWRKYGQKPIKGSPYPRGYYRCSSSKGCLARKQVERNRSDPGMFILTYTGEHNHPAPTHRNSLSGSTRQKTVAAPQTTTANEFDQPSPPKPTCSSPATSLEEEFLPPSTNTESRDEKGTIEDEDEDELGGFSDMAVNDDFFAGLEELDTPVTGDSFSDHFAVNFGLPWLPGNAAITAGSL